MMNCAKCGVSTPEPELNADELCTICAALEALHIAMTEARQRREAWRYKKTGQAEFRELPPSDR